MKPRTVPFCWQAVASMTKRSVRRICNAHPERPVFFTVLAAMAWLIGCEPHTQLVQVRVGRLAGADTIPQIALNKGYFAAEGVQIDELQFQSTQDMIAPLATGQLDVGSGSFSAAFFNAVAGNLNIKCVAGGAYTPPGHPANVFVVRNDLVSQIHTAADLRGRTVGLTAHGVSPELDLAKLLQQAGLALSDVNELLMAFPAMAGALSADQIDVAVTPEPFALQMESDDIGTAWKGDDEVIPDQQSTCLLFSSEFINNQPEAAQGYVTAYLRSVREYDDALIKRDPQARAEVVPILAAAMNLKDPALLDRLAGTPFLADGQENPESFQMYQEFFLASGLQKTPVDVARLIDTHFAEAALKTIGPYQP
jgi:NitT/TauT family transport system substrate-binding protein